MIRRFLLAFQFLTVVPVRVRGDVTGRELAASAAFFPAVGAFQGLVTGIPAFLAMKVLPADIAAAVALTLLILSNYGFDLDGLADTFDGLAIKSSGHEDEDRKKRLMVMKDSATGATGVIALVVTILLKYVLMKSLLADFSSLCAASLLFLMPVFSKWVAVPVMSRASSARPDGLGRIFIEHARAGDVALATAVLAAFCLPFVLLGLPGPTRLTTLAMCLSLLILLSLFGLPAARFLGKRFGGLTGDHFGALVEASEVIFLTAAYVWLRLTVS